MKRGTKNECEDFLDKIQTHVSINWEFGQDVAYVIKNNALPSFKEPEDLDETEGKKSGRLGCGIKKWIDMENKYPH